MVAKAPRKNLVSGRTSSVSPASGKGKGKTGGAGNPLKLWPIPKGQKGLQGFLRGGDGCGSSAAGSSSMEGTSEQSEEEIADVDSPAQNNSLVNLEDITQLNSDTEEEIANTDSPAQNSLVNLEDITQLNSDSEDD